MKTKLGLEQIRVWDTTVMALADTSVYNPDLPVENSYLEIQPPDFDRKAQVIYYPGQVTLVTTLGLGLTVTPEPLWSGIYTVYQTIKPNDKINATHYILYANAERACLVEYYCTLECEGNYKDVLLLLTDLDVAEGMAKMGEVKKANDLFKAVSKKIQQLCAGCATKK